MKRHGWLFALVFSLLWAAGCGQNNSGQSAWNSFPVPIYTDPTISGSSNAMSDFTDAMNFWEQNAGKQLFSYQGTWTNSGQPYVGNVTAPGAILANVVFVLNPWNLSGEVAGQTVVITSNGQIQSAMIMLDPTVSFCSGDCTGQSGTSERKTFAHELGHFIGMQHVLDTGNIMYPAIMPGGSLDGVTVDQPTLNSLTSS